MVFSKEDRINGLVEYLKGCRETVSEEEEKSMRKSAELFEDVGESFLNSEEVEQFLKTLQAPEE